jgi:A/G-specific adenine glycosylase
MSTRRNFIVSVADRRAFRAAIFRWYRRNARDLPWRRRSDPYSVLVSETMLQQTQVVRVIPKFEKFLAAFPTIASLARAPLADVLRLWSGLGYNSRAKRLHETARTVVRDFDGHVPRAIDELRTLPGVGRYTAGAIASFAYGADEAAVDVNVGRVLSRALVGKDRVGGSVIWELASRVVPHGRASMWNHALMDVGALFCRPNPDCAGCPARRVCVFSTSGTSERKTGVRRGRALAAKAPFIGSRRYYRGRVVRALTSAPCLSLLELGEKVKEDFAATDVAWLRDLVTELERDGLVAMDAARSHVRLPTDARRS